jgi:hypothetical protein
VTPDQLLGTLFGESAGVEPPAVTTELERLQLDALLYLIKALDAVRVLVEATRRLALPALAPTSPGPTIEDHAS